MNHIHNKFINIIILFTALNAYPSHAQNANTRSTDSLDLLINTVKNDTNKISGIISLIRKIDAKDTLKKLSYAKQVNYLAENIKWEKGLVRTNILLGEIYNHELNEYKTGIAFFEQGLIRARKLNDSIAMNFCFQQMALSYNRLNQYAKAIEYFKEALKEKNDPDSKIGMLGNIGTVYEKIGDYSNALLSYQESLKTLEQINTHSRLDSETLGMLLTTIGDIYTSMSQYDKAILNFDSALKINLRIENPFLEMPIFAGMGNAYEQEKQYDKAKEYYELGLRDAKKNKFKSNETLFLNRLGNIYTEKGELDKAMSYTRQALAIAEVDAKDNELAPIYMTLGKIYTGLKNYHDAEIYLTKALNICRQLGLLDEESKIWQQISDTYKLMGESAKALDAYKHYIATRDSVYSVKKANEIIKLEMQGDFQRKQDADKLAFNYKLQKQGIFMYSGFAGLALVLTLSFFIYRSYKQVKDANLVINKEKEKSETLLLNILPEEVAQELKDKGNVLAKAFNDVTVMFTDFVNFTSAAERMTPQELVNELDACFVGFDEIIGKYNIEKIKTVGDAYLAVAGLPLVNDNHAVDMVNAAIEINQFMQLRHEEIGNKTFRVRIGVHTGGVVAGVVGVKKFAYDIWGDSVNIAARMEQSCEAGKLNISATTYQYVKSEFNCVYRGEIDAKNKGRLGMYYVEKKRSELISS